MKNTINTLAIILLIAVGCESPNERLVNQLADTSQEVVEQNREIARTQHEVAEGSKRLVEAVAESRHEHNQLQRDLQKQRDNHYDNFNGRWGDQQHLDSFLQSYAVEKAKLEARRSGHSITESQLADGSVKLTINAGGAA